MEADLKKTSGAEIMHIDKHTDFVPPTADDE